MPDRRRTPSFEKPPVTEVALSVQFEEPLPFQVIDYRSIWELYRDKYSSYQEQPPLSPAVEAFGEDAQPNDPSMSFPRVGVRLWFENKETGGLVQFQPDRFVFNWRKSHNQDDYPRFSWVKKQFANEYGKLVAFLTAKGGPLPTPALCEVTYVNHIMAGAGWNDHSELHLVFPSLRIPSLSVEGAAAEEADVRIRFGMIGQDGQPGRLHLRAFPAVRRSDDARLFVANLVARRRPAGTHSDGVLDALHDGHDWIVQTFKDVTSSEMHRIWGLNDA